MYSIKQKKKKNFKGNRVEKEQLQQFINFQIQETEQPDASQYQRLKQFKSQQQNYLEKTKRQQSYMKSKFQFVTLEENKKDIQADKLQWIDIVQVIFPTTVEIICPICMNDSSQMVAPQITICGHIFCYPCYLGHMTLSKSKNNCPFCNSIVISDELRQVKIVHVPTPTIGQQVQFDQLIRFRINDPYLYMAATLKESLQYQRIICVNKKYVLEEILQPTIDQLKKYMNDCVSSQELDLITQVETAMMELFEKALNYQTQEKESHITQHSITNNLLSDETKFYRVFQEKHGLLEFLHPLCYKYLILEYKGKENKIDNLESKIIEIDSVTLNEPNRQKYKFLNHLPLYSNIKFIEIDMFDLLSYDNYKNYYDEVLNSKKKFKITQYRDKIRKRSDELQKTSRKTSHEQKHTHSHQIHQNQPVMQKNISAPVHKNEQFMDDTEYPDLPTQPILAQIEPVEQIPLPLIVEEKKEIKKENGKKQEEEEFKFVKAKKGKKVVLLPTWF